MQEREREINQVQIITEAGKMEVHYYSTFLYLGIFPWEEVWWVNSFLLSQLYLLKGTGHQNAKERGLESGSTKGRA